MQNGQDICTISSSELVQGASSPPLAQPDSNLLPGLPTDYTRWKPEEKGTHEGSVHMDSLSSARMGQHYQEEESFTKVCPEKQFGLFLQALQALMSPLLVYSEPFPGFTLECLCAA